MDDDWPQHLLWLYHYYPNYFPGQDVYLEVSRLLQPWGYQILVRFLSLFFEPLTLSRIFPFFLLYASCWFTFQLVEPRFGWLLALTAMIMMSVVPQERMVGFLARGFGFPLILAYLYFWVNEKRTGLYFTFLLAALFYPVSFLIIGSMQGFSYLRTVFRKNFLADLRRELLSITSLLIGAGILLLKSFLVQKNESIGPFYSRDELLSMAEFGPGGRVNFIYNMRGDLPWKYLSQPRIFDVFHPYQPVITVLLFLIPLLLLFRKKSDFVRFDWALVMLGFSGVVLFYLAQIRLPQFFLPERYLYYAYLPLVYLLFIRGFSLAQKIVNPTYLIGLISVGFVIYACFFRFSPKNIGAENMQEYAGLYETIQSIKEPVLLAGPPNICSQIPTYCRQAVLFSDEAAHAIYFRHYHEFVKPRIDDFVSAHLSTNPLELAQFLKKYQIDYLILDRAFLENGQMWFFEPYQSQINQALEQLDPSELAVNKIPGQFLREGNWQYYLLDAKAWLALMEIAPSVER